MDGHKGGREEKRFLATMQGKEEEERQPSSTKKRKTRQTRRRKRGVKQSTLVSDAIDKLLHRVGVEAPQLQLRGGYGCVVLSS